MRCSLLKWSNLFVLLGIFASPASGVIIAHIDVDHYAVFTETSYQPCGKHKPEDDEISDLPKLFDLCKTLTNEEAKPLEYEAYTKSLQSIALIPESWTGVDAFNEIEDRIEKYRSDKLIVPSHLETTFKKIKYIADTFTQYLGPTEHIRYNYVQHPVLTAALTNALFPIYSDGQSAWMVVPPKQSVDLDAVCPKAWGLASLVDLLNYPQFRLLSHWIQNSEPIKNSGSKPEVITWFAWTEKTENNELIGHDPKIILPLTIETESWSKKEDWGGLALFSRNSIFKETDFGIEGIIREISVSQQGCAICYRRFNPFQVPYPTEEGKKIALQDWAAGAHSTERHLIRRAWSLPGMQEALAPGLLWNQNHDEQIIALLNPIKESLSKTTPQQPVLAQKENVLKLEPAQSSSVSSATEEREEMRQLLNEALSHLSVLQERQKTFVTDVESLRKKQYQHKEIRSFIDLASREIPEMIQITDSKIKNITKLRQTIESGSPIPDIRKLLNECKSIRDTARSEKMKMEILHKQFLAKNL